MKSQMRKNRTSNLVPRTSQPRVYVGLSGGVDSAVSAALLKQQGYDVTGVFIKAWTPPGYICTWKEDRRSAMRAAAVLDIPFYTLDLEKEYKKDVVDYMIREYREGKTPNPDVMCNKEIKFGHFLKFALDHGVNFVATGHYSRAVTSPETRRGRDGVRVRLKEGKDKSKDQSYFLWTLSQDQLSHTLFPVGGLQKEEVRKLARKFGLPQATRKDSQGLCFLGMIDMKQFLLDFIKTQKGKVLSEAGEVIGEHDGAILYTLGERHGFTIQNQKTESKPMYVVGKDIKNNTITVADKASYKDGYTQNYASKFNLENVNVSSEIPEDGKVECRFRYRQDKIKCTVQKDQVVFDTPQLIASGQSVVFYQDEICLGGAIIAECTTPYL